MTLQFDVTLFKQLIWSRFKSLGVSGITGKIINLIIWMSCTLLVTGYLLPLFGISKDFGAFQLAGIVGTGGLFEMYGNIATMVMDFENQKTIESWLILPATATTVFVSLITYYTIIASGLSLILVPLGKLVLWGQFSLAGVAWFKLILITLCSNIMFGILCLVISAITTIHTLENVWTRFIFPLWFLGGFQFSWAAVNSFAPTFAHVLLINPIVYVMEGARAALLGQSGYLNFWVCCSALVLMSLVFFGIAYKLLKKRLDFV